MAGFLPFALAGVSFLLIAATQALSISSPKSFPSPLHHLLAAALSLALFLAAAFSAFLSPSSDHLALPFHLQILPVVSLFLLHSLSSLLPTAGLLEPLLHLLALFAFSLEFLLFYLRRPHLDGLENRYFDLLLVPASFPPSSPSDPRNPPARSSAAPPASPCTAPGFSRWASPSSPAPCPTAAPSTRLASATSPSGAPPIWTPTGAPPSPLCNSTAISPFSWFWSSACMGLSVGRRAMAALLPVLEATV